MATMPPTEASKQNFTMLFDKHDVNEFSPTIYEDENDTGILKVDGIAVFRSGSFRNSWGELTTWEGVHIDQMVENFNFLKDNGVFPDVPVRVAHPSPFRNYTEEIAGYVESLRAEDRVNPTTGRTERYLIANFDIIDEKAKAAVRNKLYRNRSSEIGRYMNNDDTEFWPTLVGVAYVDTPAVEGLNFSKFFGDSTQDCVYANESEKDMDDPVNDGEEAVEDEFTLSGNSGESGEPVAPVAAATGDAASSVFVNPSSGTSSSTSTLVTYTPIATTHEFVLNGKLVADYSVVQEYINTLEGAVKKSVAEARNAYVTGLASANKIFASLVPGLAAFALTLDGDQWEAFCKLYDEAPSIGTLGEQFANNSISPQVDKKQDKEFKILEETIQHLRSSGITEEKLQQTTTYQRYIEIKNNKETI